MSSFGTLADKSVIDVIGGALAKYYDEKNPNNNDNPYSLSIIKKIKKEYDENPDETRKNHNDIFYYYDGLVGVKQSQSVHPAGMVISPIVLNDMCGVFDKENDNCLFFDMDECHDMGLVKYDFLCLSNVEIINNACNMIGIKYPKSYQINWDDEKVWEDMLKSPYGIFQFESDFAFKLLTDMKPKNLFEMSLVTAAARPSGTSYRDDLCHRILHDNKSEIINNMLAENNGYLVYQEDVIKFLQDVCGFTGSQADTTRRAIAKKKMELVAPLLPKIKEGYCNKSTKPREIAEQEAMGFLKIIEDASSYMFGKNHSIAYCMIGYVCAYLRYYYPCEFITAYLNEDTADVDKGMELANLYGIKIIPSKYGFSKDVYTCDSKNKTIAKGIASIKYVSANVANDLYKIAKEINPQTFTELLMSLKGTSVNNKHIDILIKTDFFDVFGNNRELFQLVKMFELFGKGEKLSIKKEDVKSEIIIDVITKYAGFVLDKRGRPIDKYTFKSTNDVIECMKECENIVKSMNMPELLPKVKIANYMDVLGYVPATNKEEDRKTLIISDVTPITSKSGGIWQYRINTQSLGSGKISRLSVDKDLFKIKPLEKNSIIKVNEIKKDEKGYWHLMDYVAM